MKELVNEYNKSITVRCAICDREVVKHHWIIPLSVKDTLIQIVTCDSCCKELNNLDIFNFLREKKTIFCSTKRIVFLPGGFAAP